MRWNYFRPYAEGHQTKYTQQIKAHRFELSLYLFPFLRQAPLCAYNSCSSFSIHKGQKRQRQGWLYIAKRLTVATF